MYLNAAAVDIGINGNYGFTLEDVTVRHAISHGIQLEDYTYPAHLNRVESSYNGGSGLYVRGNKSTVYQVKESEFGNNAGYGILIEGGGNAVLNDCTAQSNTLGGIRIYRPGTTGWLTRITIDRAYFEGNGGYDLSVDAADPAALVDKLNVCNSTIPTLYLDKVTNYSFTNSPVDSAIIKSGAKSSTIIKENILGPSATFGYWSNGTLENVGVQITVTGITDIGVKMSRCTTANTQGLVANISSVKFEAGGTTANKVYRVIAVVANTSFDITADITDATEVTCYEVQPATIGADALGPDGWKKDTTVHLYRETSSTNIRKPANYGVKMVVNAATDFIIWNYDRAIRREYFSKVEASTMTFMAWIKTSVASHARLCINSTFSPYHTGSGELELLIVTSTLYNYPTTSELVLSVQGAQATGDIYISQPKLLFGSVIGGDIGDSLNSELIMLDKPLVLTNYSAAAVAADVTIDLNSELDVKIPYDIKRAIGYHAGQNTAAAKYLKLGAPTILASSIMYSQVANIITAVPFDVITSKEGYVYIDVEDANWSGYTMIITGIQP